VRDQIPTNKKKFIVKNEIVFSSRIMTPPSTAKSTVQTLHISLLRVTILNTCQNNQKNKNEIFSPACDWQGKISFECHSFFPSAIGADKRKKRNQSRG
jgi:hypothetical protein